MREYVCSCLLLALIAGCGQDSGPPPSPIVVYAPADDESRLPELFDGFTSDTRIPVSIRWGTSGDHTNKVIRDEGIPADVLITNSTAAIWHAADRGALRPIQSTALQDVPANLRDPDNFWVAVATEVAVIVQHPAAPPVADYWQLASSDYRGRLCLTSSAGALSSALVAMAIDDLGLLPAERVVRGWVQNLATAPLPGSAEVVVAIEAGQCDVGIVSARADLGTLRGTAPEPAYFNVGGLGIARHARHPEQARILIDWIIENTDLDFDPNIMSKRAGVAGFRNEEARLLVERAGYR